MPSGPLLITEVTPESQVLRKLSPRIPNLVVRRLPILILSKIGNGCCRTKVPQNRILQSCSHDLERTAASALSERSAK
jgi:hypothetical protein